jgi:hypothetical protein
MNVIILLFYLVSTFLLGWVIVKKWFDGLPPLLTVAGAFLLGTAVGVPATYILAVFFVPTGAPMLWGTVAFALSVFVYWIFARKKFHLSSVSLKECVFILFAVVFGAWVMMKTFHGGPTGELFVGSNNVFDFGLAVGLMRSMSWGANIPFGSPFFAGLPMFYHFFFNFWTAMWEYFGVPTVWAVNIPSMLSFTAFLILVYFLPQIVAKQKPMVGWVAVLLTITNSSLAFWQLLLEKGLSLGFIRDLWRLPTYPFAGPFDGSTISIFVTLNSYVNQRHLAFGLALVLFLFLSIIRDISKQQLTLRRSIGIGALVGISLLWNMMLYLLLIATVVLLLMHNKLWKQAVAFAATAGIVGFAFLLPIAGFLYKALLLIGLLVGSGGSQGGPTWHIAEYLLLNLGVLPFVAALGYLVIPAKMRRYFFPFVVLFVAEAVLAAVGRRGFEQKSYAFLIIGINVLASVGLAWLWQKKTLLLKAGAVVLFGMLTVSGVMDLLPIKNEFAFPLIGKENVPVISWIQTETPKNAVFVSYEDMIDPVVLAGRKNFYGFFKNVGFYDRSPIVRQVYAGDIALAKANGISYILVPKWEKSDFPYTVHLAALRENSQLVYEDTRYLLFNLIK